MRIQARGNWPATTISGLLILLLTGCAGLDLKETGEGWRPAVLQKDGSQMHYLRPPVRTWEVFQCPIVDIAYNNKETGSIISFTANHQTTEKELKTAFAELLQEVQKEFKGKLTTVEEHSVTLLGLPGLYGKVEGIREEDQSRVYFLHYMLLRHGKFLTFDFSQWAAVEKKARKKDVAAFHYFISSFQFQN